MLTLLDGATEETDGTDLEQKFAPHGVDRRALVPCTLELEGDIPTGATVSVQVQTVPTGEWSPTPLEYEFGPGESGLTPIFYMQYGWMVKPVIELNSGVTLATGITLRLHP